jgi:hypothetical protein
MSLVLVDNRTTVPRMSSLVPSPTVLLNISNIQRLFKNLDKSGTAITLLDYNQCFLFLSAIRFTVFNPLAPEFSFKF